MRPLGATHAGDPSGCFDLVCYTCTAPGARTLDLLGVIEDAGGPFRQVRLGRPAGGIGKFPRSVRQNNCATCPARSVVDGDDATPECARVAEDTGSGQRSFHKGLYPGSATRTPDLSATAPAFTGALELISGMPA
ncbi:MAG: hypothetical protein AAF501_14430 [Pseudomonadota bacterium]